ncbi:MULTISPECIES: HTH-type transcriptional activator AllS [Afifella]|uniref:HTH-type transcriptional activator AllS n=1 Tax=Afifella TaxID=643217 RepID=UPI000FE3969B|nr:MULTISPECIES: HTH-type transcriptional activator AllS [Afifella]MCT8268005.1 HTH-type transcriptional activator AllS [Afifella sp. JA880]
MNSGLPNLDLEAIRTFVAVARLKSFSAAAQHLHRTTSAISYRIKALEDRVGTPLFVRTTRQVTLTSAGMVLLEKATQIFEWLEELPDELRQVGDNVEPHFKLVINNLLYDAGAAAELLDNLSRAFPYTEFELRLAVYMGVWDELLHNGGHMALGAPGFHTINDDFRTHALGTIHWVFVVSPEHPLTQVPEPLSDDDLRRFPAINVQDTAIRLVKRVAWKLSGQKELLVPDLQTKLLGHLTGAGIGFLPEVMVREHLRAGRLVARRVVHPRSSSPLSLVWRQGTTGRVCSHLQELFVRKADVVAPMLRNVDAEDTVEAGQPSAQSFRRATDFN